jgi:hypothetical protein
MNGLISGWLRQLRPEAGPSATTTFGGRSARFEFEQAQGGDLIEALIVIALAINGFASPGPGGVNFGGRPARDRGTPRRAGPAPAPDAER